MPLDITEDQLALEGEPLAEVLRALDDEGWNPGGPVTKTSWLRASFISVGQTLSSHFTILMLPEICSSVLFMESTASSW